MRLLAKKISSGLSGNEVIFLSGILGAGKTFISGSIANHLGVEREVISPTFSLCREYSYNINNIQKKIFHFDLYRLTAYSQLKELSFEDILAGSNGLILVEWPECIADIDLAKKIKKLSPQRKICWIEISLAENLKDRKVVFRHE